MDKYFEKSRDAFSEDTSKTIRREQSTLMVTSPDLQGLALTQTTIYWLIWSSVLKGLDYRKWP